MRPARSYRSLFGSRLVSACALMTLGLTSGCGANAAAPTPTAPPPTAAAAAPVASPQRTPLNTPSPSPSLPSPTPSASSSASEPEQTYTVQSGDTLLSISEQFYGDATKWRRIYDANKDVIGSDPDKLKLEMKLKIPPKDTSGG
jgi:5'-nucleotidase / UDP-sugar diphosphatase